MGFFSHIGHAIGNVIHTITHTINGILDPVGTIVNEFGHVIGKGGQFIIAPIESVGYEITDKVIGPIINKIIPHGYMEYYMGYSATSIFGGTPNVMEQAIANALVGGSTNIGQTIIDTYPQMLFRKFEHMYRYADQGKYIYGLPNFDAHGSLAVTPATVRKFISKYVAYVAPTDQIEIHYSNMFQGVDHTYWAMKMLIQEGRWDPVTGAISNGVGNLGTIPNGSIITEDNFFAGGIAKASGGGPKPVGPINDANNIIIGTTVYHPEHKETHTVPGSGDHGDKEVTVTIPAYYDLTPFQAYAYGLPNIVGGYCLAFIARVVKEDGTPKTGWFGHEFIQTQMSQQVWQDLVPTSGQNPFYPIVPIKRANHFLRDADSNAFNSAKKMLHKLRIDFDEVTKNVEQSSGQNKVLDCYLVFATNVQAEGKWTALYIYYYLKWIQASAQHGGGYNTIESVSHPVYETHHGGGAHGDSKVLIGHTYTYRAHVSKYANVFTHTDETYKVTYTYDDIVSTIKSGRVAKRGRAVKIIRDQTITCQYQISDNSYEEITITGFKMDNTIYGGHHAFALMVHASNPNEDPNAFLLPLNRDVLKQIPMHARDWVLGKSGQLVFYTEDPHYVKWWQTSAFGFIIKFVMAVIAIVMIVFSWGTMTAPAMALYAAVVAGTSAAIAAALVQLAMQVIRIYLTRLIVQYAMKQVVKWAGPEFAMILSLAAEIYGVCGQTGFDLPLADSALALSGPMMSASMEAWHSEVMGDIMKEATALNEFVTTTSAELKTAKTELGIREDLQSEKLKRLDPQAFCIPIDQPFYESPEAFVTRKSTTATQALMGADYIKQFYASKLSLDI